MFKYENREIILLYIYTLVMNECIIYVSFLYCSTAVLLAVCEQTSIL